MCAYVQTHMFTLYIYKYNTKACVHVWHICRACGAMHSDIRTHMRTCMYAFVYVCTDGCIFDVYMQVCLCTYVCACTYPDAYVLLYFMYASMCVCTCWFTCMYVRTYVCMYTCVYMSVWVLLVHVYQHLNKCTQAIFRHCA